MFKRAEESVTKVRALARGEFGELQVGYVPPLELHILPRALAEFQKTTPGVKVVLHDLGSDEICNKLRNGILQPGLMMQPSEESTGGIKFEAIGHYPFFVAMAASHSLARRKAISLDMLAQERLVVLDRRRNSEFHRILKRVFAPLQPNIATESDSVNSLITEIGVGKRVAVVSQLFKEAIGKRLTYRR
jgi:DNA-binding transcriptional LysR family regulator